MPNHETTSEAEEMYIITVARAVEDGSGPPVPVSDIAGALEVSSVAANQMIKKLEGAGLVTYTPYKGVTLTEAGDDLANSVLRSRRLWGRFLVDHLGLAPIRADEVACEMEHVTPDTVADRLAVFLGDPTTGPTGRPIPRGSGSVTTLTVSLADIATGESVIVVTVDHSHATFLRAQGIGEGTEVTVLGIGADGSVLIQGPSGTLHLAADVTKSVVVAPGQSG